MSDLVRCGLELLGEGADAYGFGSHCESAFQQSDFEDNKKGLDCSANTTCDSQCSPLIGKRATPGPFWELGMA